MTVMRTKTVAPWFGSNRMLASHVGEALRGCEWVGIPLAGGMSEVPYIEARTVLVNDLHWHVMNLASVIRDERLGPAFYRKVRRVLFHPRDLHEAQSGAMRHRVRQPETLGDFDAAYDYFVAVWMGRSAKAGCDDELRGGLALRFNAGGGDSAVRYQSAVASINAWRRALRRCTFSTLDAFEFLAKCHDAEGHGIYCDPPFPGPGDGYRHTFSEQDHRRLARVLASYEHTRVVCRFYDHPLVRELYTAFTGCNHDGHWYWRPLGGGRKQSNAAAPEVLLCNYPIWEPS